jgi:hypothetical protein
MHNNIGFFANWLPGDHMELGAVGVLKEGRFRQEATLGDLGINIETDVAGSPQTLQYTSTSGTSIKNAASAGTSVPVAKAEISIEFSSEGAFVFNATNVRQTRISNRFEVADQILAAYLRDRWRKDWYVIESLRTAQMATIVVSQDRSAGLVLSVQSNLPIPSTALADPEVDLSVSATRGKIFQILAAENLKPLYSCLRVKDPIFGQPKVAAVLGKRKPEQSLERFARPGIVELLES